MLKRINARFSIPFLLFFICILAYFPLSSGLFALKNDAFAFNFPNKYFFSESLRYGYLPTWNPYLNYGFPLYADPGFAWWNPITWIFGFIGYNAYTFTIEILLYIYLGGLGMYWLVRKFNFLISTSFSIAVMFMCSGFFIGNLQHVNFITCAAFIPWLIGFWLQYQKTPNFKNFIGCSVSAYLLFTAGHPAIPLATTFFLFLLSTLYYFFFHSNHNLKIFFFQQIKLLIGIFIFLLPLLLSYWQILPHYSRTGSVDQTQSVNTGFSIGSYISFLYPLATIKDSNIYMTDVSMRNAYFSIPGFLCFISFLIGKEKNKIQQIFLFAGLVMLALSLGGEVKESIYNNLPLFSWIKTNGEFRVFPIFCFLICCAFEIEKIFKEDYLSFQKLKYLLLIVTIASLGFCVLLTVTKNIFLLPDLNQTFIETAKNIIDNLSIWQSFFLASLITTMFAAAYLLCLSNNTLKHFFILILFADIFFSCWLLLPITGVGKTSVARMQSILNKSPQGFPSPFKPSNRKINKLSSEEDNLIINWSWYDKKIIHPKIDYPSQLKSTETFLNSDDSSMISGKPFIYLQNQNCKSLFLTHFSPTNFEIQLTLLKPDTLIILQNNFPGWEATVNHKPTPIISYANTFMAIPLNKNKNVVKIKFMFFNF
jgi:hypothetical protein